MSPGEEREAGFSGPPDDRSGYGAGRGESYPPERTVEESLAEIRRWSRAARLVADNPALTIRAKCKALIDMSFRARRTEIPAFLEAAIWKGCRHLFEEELEVPADVLGAIRRLRHQGHDRCPECRRHLPDHEELDRWRELTHDFRRPA